MIFSVVGSTSGWCYFLQQCQCLSVCVLCVLVRCVKSCGWVRRDLMYFTITLFNTNNSIQHYSFTCIQLNSSKYCYVISIIQFRHTIKEFQVLLFSTNNSIQLYLFIFTQLNGSKYCYVILIIPFRHTVKEFQVLLCILTIYLNSHLFTLMVKQFYF